MIFFMNFISLLNSVKRDIFHSQLGDPIVPGVLKRDVSGYPKRYHTGIMTDLAGKSIQ